MTFDAFRSQLFDLHSAGDWQAAYEFCVANSAEFPGQEQRFAYWLSCLQSRLNQPDSAIVTLEEALDAGYWFSPNLLRSADDLQPLQESARFEQIVALSETRLMEALEASTPSRISFEPTPMPEESVPLLLVLHGNESNVKQASEQWLSLAEAGWLVVLPQSSQVSGPERYVWDDADLSYAEVLTHFDEISAEYNIDPKRIVLGGFSNGGRRALEMALNGDIAANGYIGIAPAVHDSAEIPNSNSTNLALYFAIGERDTRTIPGLRATAAALEAQGLRCHVHEFAGAHQYPNEMEPLLAEAIAFVSK